MSGYGTGPCCHLEVLGETRKEMQGDRLVSIGARMTQCRCAIYVPTIEEKRRNAYTIDDITALRNSLYTPPAIIYEPTQERWELPKPQPPQPKSEPSPIEWPPRRELDL